MLYNDDCIKIMKTFPSGKVNMIFADPPYFLSNDGLSIHSGKVFSVNKGEWDKAKNYDSIETFTTEWLTECYRLLKQGATIWVSGTQHNIFDVQRIMKKIGYKIIIKISLYSASISIILIKFITCILAVVLKRMFNIYTNIFFCID